MQPEPNAQGITAGIIEVPRRGEGNGRLFNEDTLRWFKCGEELGNVPIEGEYAPEARRFSLPETLCIGLMAVVVLGALGWLIF